MSKCQFTAILSFYDEKALKAGLENCLPWSLTLHNTAQYNSKVWQKPSGKTRKVVHPHPLSLQSLCSLLHHFEVERSNFVCIALNL